MCRGGRHGRMRQGHQMSLSAEAMVENQGENNLSKTTKNSTKMEVYWETSWGWAKGKVWVMPMKSPERKYPVLKSPK